MNKFTEIGNEMMQYADQADFTAQRGLIDELFPFIYMASKRMSLRAITRWLEDNHRIQISVNAVAKAMRNQDEYWARLVEDVEPSARVVAEAYDVDPLQMLDSFDLFRLLETKPPTLDDSGPEGPAKAFRQLAVAVGVLRNRWFSLPEEARNQCRRHFVGVFFDPEEPPKEVKKHEHRKQPRGR